MITPSTNKAAEALAEERKESNKWMNRCSSLITYLPPDTLGRHGRQVQQWAAEIERIWDMMEAEAKAEITARKAEVARLREAVKDK